MNASQLATHFGRGYLLLARCASFLASPLLLVIRVYWGWQFFGTGKGKLMDIQKVAGFFADNHIPLPTLSAVLAGTTECVGGLFLLAGLASRLTTIPLIFTMIIAYLTVESDSLKVIFSDPDKFTGATPFLFLFACVIVFVFGPGVFSLDWIIGRRYAKRSIAAVQETAPDEPARF
jgi:putative oxidoreductase